MGSIVLSLFSLALAATAYWRSGGREDAKRVRREIEHLKTKQQELGERLGQSIAAAYEASRQRLQFAREALRQTKEEAFHGIEQQLQRAQMQLETLAHHLEEAARSAKEASVNTARSVERAIGIRVRRIEARALLLRAKAKTTLAVTAASKEDPQRAEERLREATELVRTAHGVLNGDHAYDQLFQAMKESLRSATTAVQQRAQNLRARIEEVLQETDRLVSSLEADEQEASDHDAVATHADERERAVA
jgi:cellobiose-specific phosphotransferase system component IIA